MTTLMNERSALGASGSRRGAGTIDDAVSLWAARPELHTPVLRDRLTQLWLRAEAQRLTSERSRAAATVGGPGPEGSIGKMVGAELNQHIYEFCMDLLGPEGHSVPRLRDDRRRTGRVTGGARSSSGSCAAAPTPSRAAPPR